MEQNVFDELEVDPIQGTQIMQLAGINPDQLMSLSNVAKLRDIMKLFSGKEDSSYMITHLLAGKPGLDPIEHLYGYTKLRNEYDAHEKKTNLLKEQLNYYER